MEDKLKKELIQIALIGMTEKRIFCGFEILSYKINDNNDLYMIVELRSLNSSKKSYNVFFLPTRGLIQVEEKI